MVHYDFLGRVANVMISKPFFDHENLSFTYWCVSRAVHVLRGFSRT